MTMLKSLVAASVGLVGGAHAFWRMECPGRSGLGRLDPIVSPGEVSSHVHAIAGSGAFGLTADTLSLLGADCTSCRAKEDKSAYWTPAMYFKDTDTGKFELVEQVGGMLAYYLLNQENITAFPRDFRMVSGDNYRRSYTVGDPNQPDPPKSNWASLGQTGQKDLQQRAIGFNCLNYGKDPEATLYRHFLPDKQYLDAHCQDGLRLEVMFPSCWDGKNTDSDNHKDHVAFPDLVITGQCPESHPVNLPGILFETIWDTHAFEGRNGMFVMANGDPTGFGYHGDFIMGWEEDTLEKAVKTCTNPSGRIEDCSVFTVIDEAEAKMCSFAKPLGIMAEQLLDNLDMLPGDVPITYEDGKPDSGKPSSKPSLTYQPGASASESALPGQVFKESSTSVAPEPTTTSESVEPTPPVVNVAAVATSSTSSSAPAPTTTPAPSAAPVDPNVEYFSTQYVTNGNLVSKILWQEEVVWETEIVDSSTTVTVRGGPPSSVPAPEPAAPVRRRAAHLHGHGRHHHF